MNDDDKKVKPPTVTYLTLFKKGEEKSHLPCMHSQEQKIFICSSLPTVCQIKSFISISACPKTMYVFACNTNVIFLESNEFSDFHVVCRFFLPRCLLFARVSLVARETPGL